MEHYFASRAALLDQGSIDLLTRLVALGGYCTVSQATSLNVVKRTRARLRWLERLGFLRKVAAYPVVYQVTTSTARLLGHDSGTRRRHTLETVQTRLLGVDFFLEACHWPTEFIFDHEQKITTFTECAYPLSVLPQRAGKPYLREHFVMWLANGRIGVGIVDQPQPKALSQLKQFIRQFQPAYRHLRDGLDLLVITGCHLRQQLYWRLVRSNRIRKLGLEQMAKAVKLYRVRRPTQSVAALLWPPAEQHDEIKDDTHPEGAPERLWRSCDGSRWGEN